MFSLGPQATPVLQNRRLIGEGQGRRPWHLITQWEALMDIQERVSRTPPCPVTIEAMGGRKFRRCVYNPHPTGHVAHMWVGTPMYQWKGWSWILYKRVIVFGYSPILPDDAESPEMKQPNEWADDTY